MGKMTTGPNGYLSTRTNTKEIWMNDKGEQTIVPLGVVPKKKGKNYHKVSCIECQRPRDIRGNYCSNCRKDILTGKL